MNGAAIPSALHATWSNTRSASRYPPTMPAPAPRPTLTRRNPGHLPVRWSTSVRLLPRRDLPHQRVPSAGALQHRVSRPGPSKQPDWSCSYRRMDEWIHKSNSMWARRRDDELSELMRMRWELQQAMLRRMLATWRRMARLGAIRHLLEAYILAEKLRRALRKWYDAARFMRFHDRRRARHALEAWQDLCDRRRAARSAWGRVSHVLDRWALRLALRKWRRWAALDAFWQRNRLRVGLATWKEFVVLHRCEETLWRYVCLKRGEDG